MIPSISFPVNRMFLCGILLENTSNVHVKKKEWGGRATFESFIFNHVSGNTGCVQLVTGTQISSVCSSPADIVSPFHYSSPRDDRISCGGF